MQHGKKQKIPSPIKSTRNFVTVNLKYKIKFCG